MEMNSEGKNPDISQEKISLWRLFLEFFKIGLFTFGGGMAMLPIIERIVVDEKQWIDREELLNAFSLSQAIPGVIAVSSSSYVGRRMRGIPGAIVTTFGVILPSLLVICVLSVFLSNIGDNPYVQGAFRAVKATVCGLIISSCIRLGGDILKSPFGIIVSVLSFLAIVFVKVTAVWVIIAGAVAGVLVTYYKDKKKLKEADGEDGESL